MYQHLRRNPTRFTIQSFNHVKEARITQSFRRLLRVKAGAVGYKTA
jgi:hypothetical protein